MKVSDQAPTRVTINDENTMPKVNDQKITKRKPHTYFEWIHLIAAICIPIVIAVYTFVDNNHKESIASDDRLKDVKIANNSRIAELDIAQANRLHEITIAELSRQKDRDLALDQQRENILVQYETFLANLLMENGMTLNKTPTAKTVAVSMVLTALTQLDTRRRSVLVRSLYLFKLITLRTNGQPTDTSVLQLGLVDMSNIIFGSSYDSPAERPPHLYIDWYYLWLPFATLTNVSFRHSYLGCATLSKANMDSADLSFATQQSHICFGTTRAGQIDFSLTSLINASLYRVRLGFASFANANLTFANMREFYCKDCIFGSAKLLQVDLSFSRIFTDYASDHTIVNFDLTVLRQAVMHSAYFGTIRFFQSDWSKTQASQIQLRNCTFTNAIMDNCSLTNSFISLSVFQNASLLSVDFSSTTFANVSFANSDMRNANMSYIQCNYCDFTNVTFQGAVLNNASFHYSNFLNCDIKPSQLDQAINLFGSILPNGTVVKSNE